VEPRSRSLFLHTVKTLNLNLGQGRSSVKAINAFDFQENHVIMDHSRYLHKGSTTFSSIHKGEEVQNSKITMVVPQRTINMVVTIIKFSHQSNN
jgi:hypothetical protein